MNFSLYSCCTNPYCPVLKTHPVRCEVGYNCEINSYHHIFYYVWKQMYYYIYLLYIYIGIVVDYSYFTSFKFCSKFQAPLCIAVLLDSRNSNFYPASNTIKSLRRFATTQIFEIASCEIKANSLHCR